MLRNSFKLFFFFWCQRFCFLWAGAVKNFGPPPRFFFLFSFLCAMYVYFLKNPTFPSSSSSFQIASHNFAIGGEKKNQEKCRCRLFGTLLNRRRQPKASFFTLSTPSHYSNFSILFSPLEGKKKCKKSFSE